MLQQGIVLRNYFPQQQKVSLLDITEGRIACMIQDSSIAPRLANGSLIEYVLDKPRNSYRACGVDIIYMPLTWHHAQFLFLHHLLELCYYFLPLNCHAQEIFYLVKALYCHEDIMQNEITKKIFLCRFFSMLGIYPADAASYGAVFFNLISAHRGSIDNKVAMPSRITDKIMQDKLKNWLLGCIAMHPYSYKLKTLDYLKTVHDYEKK